MVVIRPKSLMGCLVREEGVFSAISDDEAGCNGLLTPLNGGFYYALVTWEPPPSAFLFTVEFASLEVVQVPMNECC